MRCGQVGLVIDSVRVACGSKQTNREHSCSDERFFSLGRCFPIQGVTAALVLPGESGTRPRCYKHEVLCVSLLRVVT